MRIDTCVMAAAPLVLPHAATAQGPVRYGTTQNQRGAEALAEFTPSVKLDNSAAVDRLHADSYMGNVVVALPLGAKGQLQPTDTTFNSTSAVGQFTEGLLSGLDFWRANIGVAIRW